MRNTAKAYLMLLVALFAFAQGSWAQEKKTAKLSLSQNSYDYEVYGAVFEAPQLTIDVDGNTNLGYQFTRQYNVVGTDGKIIEGAASEASGLIYSTDPTTGTKVKVDDGLTFVGGKTGEVTVRLTVTPLPEYADQYSNAPYTTYYTINIKKATPALDVFSLKNNDSEMYTDGEYNVTLAFKQIKIQHEYYTETNTYNQESSTPIYSFKQDNSKFQNIVDNSKIYNVVSKDFDEYITTIKKSLDASNWEITSVIDGSADAFTLNNNIIKTTKAGTGKVTYTLTPKIEGYNPLTKEVNVTVQEPTSKIPVHIEFYYNHKYDNKKVPNDPNNNSYAQKGGTFDVPDWPKDKEDNDIHEFQFDKDGNVITKKEKFDQFVYSGQRFHPLSAKVTDDYGNDITDMFTLSNYSQKPYVVINDTATYKMDSGYFDYTDNDYQFTAGIAWLQTRSRNQQELESYSTQAPNAVRIKYTTIPKYGYEDFFETASDSYSLIVLPRTLTISISPDPSTVLLPYNFVMSPNNRFKLDVSFKNLLSGEITTINNYGATGSQYLYYLDINKDLDGKLIFKGNDEQKQLDYTREYKDEATGESKNITFHQYKSLIGFGNDAFKMEFTEPGEYKLKYVVKPWVTNVYLPSEATFTYKVKDPIRGKLVIDPSAYVTYVNENIQKPAVKVVNSVTGEDITSHYDLEFSLANGGTGTAWVNPTEGNTTKSTDNELQIGGTVGNVTVTVNAYGKLDASEYYPDCEGTYTVEVKEKPNPMCSWEIIKAGNPSDALMGKLHFTGAGGLSAGYQLSNAVPGLNITFGKKGEDDLQASPVNTQTEGEGNTDGVKVGDKQYISGANVTTDENGLPTSGTFFVLQPYTNGFVSADAYWESGKSYILTDATGKQIETISGDGSYSTKNFSTALRAGQTYYLYAAGAAMKLHGMAYEPTFLADGSNEKIAELSIIGNNTSTLPHLLSEANSNVELSATPAEDITQWENVDVPVLPEKIEKDINATITANVKSLYTDGNVSSGEIYKQPSYKLKVTAIPSYWVTDGRYAGNGQEVTTTNIPTNIRMYYGGWEGGANSPYMKEDKQETNMADDWTMATAATEDKGIDGFKFVTGATNIPRDERGWGMGQNERFKKYSLDAFNVPCRGSFVRFEPEENGTVIVYLMQNGICQWNSALQGWATNKTLQWNNVYITDETSANVALTDNLWGENNGDKDGGLYTTSKIQASLFGTETNGNAPKSVDVNDGSNWDWDTEFMKAGNGTEADRQTLFSNWTQKNCGDRSKAMRFSDGGLGVISDGYTRYTFNVKAGKTYFVAQRDAQLAFAGFSFVPEGFSSTYSKDAPVPGHTDKTYELDQNNKVNEAFLNQIKSESADASAYSNVNVRLNRTFDQGKWAPLCLPFSVNQTQFKQIFGDDAKIITFDYIRPNKTAHYTQHVYHYIEAGRPYFVMPSKKVEDEEGATTTTFKHVSLEGVWPITMSQESPNAAPFNYKFVGFYDPTDIPQYSYYMTTNNEIRRVEAAKRPMKGFRAYLEYDENNSTVPAAEAKIFDDGTATGIKTISVDERNDEDNQLLPNNGNVYDVSGRLVNRKGNIGGLQRGVYISGGKKVVVK